MFYALAIVCDDFFVPSLEKICEVRDGDLEPSTKPRVTRGMSPVNDRDKKTELGQKHSGREDHHIATWSLLRSQTSPGKHQIGVMTSSCPQAQQKPWPM